jgi:putative endopeptidase
MYRNLILSIACASALAAVSTGCRPAEANKGVGVDAANFDTTVNPGKDFFQYANGGWCKANPIPADQSRWASFSILSEENKKNLRTIAEQLAAKSATEGAASKEGVVKGSSEQLIGDFYYSAMDTANIEKLGASPVKPDMDAIDKITDLKGLLAMVAKMQMELSGPMFNFGASQDPKNSEVTVPQIYQGGIGLPDRDYYLKTDPRSQNIREEYGKYIVNLFKLYGEKEADAARDAAAIMRIETDLAKASMTRVEQRDPYKTYHKVSIDDLNKLTPSLNWGEMMSMLKVTGKYDYLVLGQPDFLKELENQLKKTSLNDWKVYLKWNVLSSAAPYLSNDFVMQSYHFNNEVLNGQKQIQDRWKRVVNMTDSHIGDALGQLYVAKYFPPDAKKKADELVSNLMAVYKERIQKLDWMSNDTKKKAVEKLEAFTRKIGYTDKWKTYEGLAVTRDNFFQNIVNATVWNNMDQLNKVGKPVDRTVWGMTPPTVNAYYNPQNNEIVFPAGILQPPFFNKDADDAVNYGAIGAVIGHEMTHGFDDQGRNFDAKGNLTNWWTSDDSAKFVAKAKVVIEQFNKYTVLDTLHVNGQLTLGENIADLGGLSIAYEAFKRTEQGKSNEKIDGLTPDQRFFLGFARIWASNIRPEAAAQRIMIDPHSPSMYRVNGPLSNMPEFYSAFGVKEDAPLYRKTEDRAKIW